MTARLYGIPAAAWAVLCFVVGAAWASGLAEGEALFIRGRYREAAAAFRQALLARPRDPWLWLWYGASLVQAGDLRGALHALRPATGSSVEAHAWLWAGAAYEGLGMDSQARNAYRRALARSQDAASAYWARRKLRALTAESAPELPATDPGTYERLAVRYNPRLSAWEARRIGRALVELGRHFNVDPRLTAALVVVESGFEPRAVSPAGALGLGQLMPEVARAVAVRDPFSIEENLYGTVRVLRGHLDRYGYHRVDLALAAYNAGSGAVRRHGGVPPFVETRWYVFRVSRLYLRFLGQ